MRSRRNLKPSSPKLANLRAARALEWQISALGSMREALDSQQAAAIRALAARDPYVQTDNHVSTCISCGVTCPDEVDVGHAADCAWNLAVAWCKANPVRP